MLKWKNIQEINKWLVGNDRCKHDSTVNIGNRRQGREEMNVYQKL